MIRVAEKVNPTKYGRLLTKTLPVIIKTEAENDRAILIVEGLLAKGDKLSSEDRSTCLDQPAGMATGCGNTHR